MGEPPPSRGEKSEPQVNITMVMRNAPPGLQELRSRRLPFQTCELLTNALLLDLDAHKFDV